MFGGLGLGLAAALIGLFARRPSAVEQASVDDTAVRVESEGGAVVLAKPEIASAWDQDASVHLETHGGARYVLRFRDAADARAFVEALDLGLGKRRLSWQLRGAVGAGTAGFAGGILGLVTALMIAQQARIPPTAATVVGLLVATIACGFAAARLSRGRVTVGADGVAIERVWRRFVRFDRIRYARPSGDKIRLGLDDGTLVLLSVVGQTDAEVDVLLRRLQDGMRAAASAVPDLADLEPAGRTLTDWRRDVSKLGGRAADFRTQALESADLEAILGDATAPLGRRVGAALALGAIDRERVRVRLHDLSEASADARTRVVLGALADESLDDEHLSMVEAEAEERRLERRRAEARAAED